MEGLDKGKETDDFFNVLKTGDSFKLEAFLVENQLTLNVNRVRW